MVQVENKKKKTPTALVILDGFGYRKEKHGNAVAEAHMPTWQMLCKKYPHTLLKASGEAVGLPEGYMGNSEVGHLCIGAGRVVETPFCKFHKSIESGEFFKNEQLISLFKGLKNNSLHVMGLLSDAGVHAHEAQLYAVVQLAKRVGVKNTYIHAFLDGRDTLPSSAKTYLQRLSDFCCRESYGVIASLHGRFYAMDRDNNWERTEKSYAVLCGETAEKRFWEDVIDDAYTRGITDEFVEPVLIQPQGGICDGDGIFFTNFRPDRARQLSECFLNSKFDAFVLSRKKISFFVTPVRYEKQFEKFSNTVLFEDEKIAHTLLDEIATQTNEPVFIIAETEKYAHVTYFFRGKVDVQRSNEKRVLIPSKKMKTYAECPEMSAREITQQIVASLEQEPAFFYLVNYANCDMVGHSGNFEAGVKACEVIDEQLAILYKEIVVKRDGTIYVTADHGNVEEMIVGLYDVQKTSHTIHPVPFVVVNKKHEGMFCGFDEPVRYGIAAIAPTILTDLELKVPLEMQNSLVIR